MGGALPQNPLESYDARRKRMDLLLMLTGTRAAVTTNAAGTILCLTNFLMCLAASQHKKVFANNERRLIEEAILRNIINKDEGDRLINEGIKTKEDLLAACQVGGILETEIQGQVLACHATISALQNLNLALSE